MSSYLDKMDLDKMDEWLKSEECQKKISDTIQRLNDQEMLDEENEKKSNLKYRDGQKVLRGDVFIDEDHEESEDFPYGVESYVYRINEDGTIDNCFGCCIALKANDYKFDSERSRLVKRNGKLYDPLFDDLMFEEEG